MQVSHSLAGPSERAVSLLTPNCPAHMDPSPSSQPSAIARTQSHRTRASLDRHRASHHPLARTHRRSSHRMIHDSNAFLTVTTTTTTTMQFRRDSPGTNRSSPRIAPSFIASPLEGTVRSRTFRRPLHLKGGGWDLHPRAGMSGEVSKGCCSRGSVRARGRAREDSVAARAASAVCR